MLFVQRHRKVCSRPFKFPSVDFASVSIDYRNLADGCEVYKNPGSLFLQLKRLGMGAKLKLTLDPFVGCRVEHPNGAVAISHIDPFGCRLITNLIHIVPEIQGLYPFVAAAIKHLPRT